MLLDNDVPPKKISTLYSRVYKEARENFVRDLSTLLKDKGEERFAVAEGGVYKGEFAKIINESFPESKLYLFDTFEGFDSKDAEIDKQRHLSDAKRLDYFSDTNEFLVLSKMVYPDNVVVCKGYFPETTAEIPEETYGFVNLDFDLYNPTLEGLRYFFPRMMIGGCILIHDYYHHNFRGIKEAVATFIDEIDNKYILTPIGDHFSIAIFRV